MQILLCKHLLVIAAVPRIAMPLSGELKEAGHMAGWPADCRPGWKFQIPAADTAGRVGTC